MPPTLKKIYTWEELKNMQPPEWLVPGKVPRGFSRLYGEPGIGKTFFALDIALTLAVQAQPVIYVAGEGKPGIPKRVQAWLAKHEFLDASLVDAFFVHDGPVNMLSDDEVNAFISAVGPRVPALVVIDTVARCFGAGDENGAKDMGQFVRNCDRLRGTWPGASVLILHHTGKDERRGARGSSAGLGAVDCDMQLSGSTKDWLRLDCAKQKDAEPFKPEFFTLRRWGESCVLERVAGQGVVCEAPAAPDKYELQILGSLSQGSLRFGELLKRVEMARSTLAKRLEKLETTGRIVCDGDRYGLVS